MKKLAHLDLRRTAGSGELSNLHRALLQVTGGWPVSPESGGQTVGARQQPSAQVRDEAWSEPSTPLVVRWSWTCVSFRAVYNQGVSEWPDQLLHAQRSRQCGSWEDLRPQHSVGLPSRLPHLGEFLSSRTSCFICHFSQSSWSNAEQRRSRDKHCRCRRWADKQTCSLLHCSYTVWIKGFFYLDLWEMS